MIERLQTKQIALLAAQKFQIYYKRITWHPDKDSTNELSEGGDDLLYNLDPDWADIDPRNLPPLNDPVEDDSESDSDNSNIDMNNKEENEALLAPISNSGAGKLDDDVAPIDSQQTFDSININLSSPNVKTTTTRPKKDGWTIKITKNYHKCKI